MDEFGMYGVPMGNDFGMMGPEQMGFGVAGGVAFGFPGGPGYPMVMNQGMGSQWNQVAQWGQMDSILDRQINSGFGEYGYGVPFEADRAKLLSLGFNLDDINFLERIVLENKNRMPTSSKLYQMGISGQAATMLRYMYGISTGRIQVNTWEDMQKHLKKMYQGPGLSIGDLPVSKTTSFARFCVVAGVPKPWDILNSARYVERLGLSAGMYEVDKVGAKATVLISKRRPVLKFGEAKDVEGHIRVVEECKDGSVKLAVDNHHVRMLNRFIVIATMRKTYEHLGCDRIMAPDGTTVYVVAIPLKSGNTQNYYNTASRVYAYGVDKQYIEPYLSNVSQSLYNMLGGMAIEREPATIEYRQMLDNDETLAERKAAEEAALADSFFDSVDGAGQSTVFGASAEQSKADQIMKEAGF